MFDIQIIDQYSLYTHFLELTASYFPLKNFQIKSKTGTLNVQFKNQPINQPLIYIYILSTNSYEGYKNTARARLMKYFEDYPSKNSIILFFPSLLRVDEKVNKILQQTHELICADLQMIKQFPREKVQKIIFYDPDRELNKEQCMREFLYSFQQQIQLLLEHELEILDDQIYDCEQSIQEKAFSFYKLYALKEKKAKIYEKLGLKQDALDIYIGFEQFFIKQYPKSIQPIFNAIHPFDFLVRKTIDQNIRNFEESGDESQSTILDFLVLIQFRIIDLLSTGNQIFGVEKILMFSEQIADIVKQQMIANKEKQQFHQDEEELWGLGLLIWQYFNMKNSVSLMASVPLNLSEDLLLPNLQSQLKVRFTLLNIVEKLGFTLYQIRFNDVRKLSLEKQCQLLEETVLDQVDNIEIDGVTIMRKLESEPKDLFRTYLLSDSKLKRQIHNLADFSQFYSEVINDIIAIANQLNLKRVIFEHLFMILKLKNVYPSLELNQDCLDKCLNQTQLQFKNLNSSLLIQKLIYYYREKMELSFQETFRDTLQSTLPGNKYTKLFKILKLPLTKLKLSYVGYFEQFQVKKRVTYTDFLFRFTILKYFQVECDGVFTITLKQKSANLKDKRKLKLVTGPQSLKDEKKTTYEFQQALNTTQGGLYSIRKVTFLSGPFKLYFDVSQKVQQLKLHIMHPTIQIQPIQKITNIGTPILFSISDLPLEINSLELNIIAKIKISSALYSLDGTEIISEKNLHKVSVKENFLIQHPFVLQLYAFEDVKDLNIKLVVSIKNHQFATNFKLDAEKIVEITDFSDKIDDEFELYEIKSLRDQEVTIQNGDQTNLLEYRNCLRQVIQRGKLIQIIQKFNFKEVFNKFGLIDDIYYDQLESLYNKQQNLQTILQIKKNLYDIYQIKQKALLFKIQAITLFNQEKFIPYSQPDYFDMTIKIQYLGEDEEQFLFELASHYPKQSRQWKDIMSNDKTINLINIKCFLTGTEDFEKPQIKVFLNKEDKIYEIDEKYVEIDYTLRIDEQLE